MNDKEWCSCEIGLDHHFFLFLFVCLFASALNEENEEYKENEVGRF